MDLNENDQLNESGFTEFPGVNTNGPSVPLSGRFAAFFRNRFGINKGDRKRRRGRPPMASKSMQGDTIANDDPLADDDSSAGLGISKSFKSLPAVEYERRKRYNSYEKMEEFPEIGAALDIYADDATQEHLDGGIFSVETTDEIVKEMVEEFLEDLHLEKYIWDITRNICKYGDCFVENIVDMNNEEAGIQRIKILNPIYIFRKEDKFGYLHGFIQEIPKRSNAANDGMNGLGKPESNQTVNLDKHQLIHFRAYTSDPNYYPYGKSVLAAAVRSWRSLRMLEDAMIIYRLHRAPERRVFYFEAGNMPSSKIEAFIEKQKAKFKKEDFFNNQTNAADSKFNPTSPDEDFWVPQRNGKGGKIEVLPGAQNLGDIDDVRYFRDKVLAAMKVPKDFVVEKDKSPERKANLSQLDVKFAKAVMRIQRDVEIGLNTLVKRHLELRGVDESLYKRLKLKLAPPSDLSQKRKLELEEQKTRAVQALKGLQLFPDDWIYENYYQMTDSEIEKIKEQMKAQLEEQAEMMAGDPAAGGGMPPNGTPPSEPQPQ